MKWYNELGMIIVGLYFFIAFTWAVAILLDDCTDGDKRAAAIIVVGLVFLAGVVMWSLP